jgi:serine/threonine protein kinase
MFISAPVLSVVPLSFENNLAARPARKMSKQNNPPALTPAIKRVSPSLVLPNRRSDMLNRKIVIPGSLAHKTGQADLTINTYGRGTLTSHTKYFSGGFASEGLFAFTRSAVPLAWGARSRAVLNKSIEQGTLKEIGKGQGTMAQVFVDKKGVAYKVGTFSSGELKRAVALSRTGLGPKIYVEKSFWNPVQLGASAGHGVLAMEHFKGQVLDQSPALRQTSSPEAKRALIKAMGQSVAKYHSLGWAHRDLHARNIMVQNENGQLVSRMVIIDSGAAKPLNAKFAKTSVAVDLITTDLISLQSLVGKAYSPLQIVEHKNALTVLGRDYQAEIHKQNSGVSLKNILQLGLSKWALRNNIELKP